MQSTVIEYCYAVNQIPCTVRASAVNRAPYTSPVASLVAIARSVPKPCDDSLDRRLCLAPRRLKLALQR